MTLALTDASRYTSTTTTDPVSGETQERATFHVGADANQTVFISIAAMTANRLGTIDGSGTAHAALNTVDVSSTAGANTAISTISLAIGGVSSLRSQLGAFQTYTLESNAANLRVASENLTAAESNIRDTDMAMEMVQFTKHQIMLQAGTAMLAQANLIPQTVLQLLR
jgi:flagellin